ncbi:hypothetical protein BU26DRAFT_555891 [Trematosphaeria pertusa]|uniref:Uncharacterized protein n=1 Tax=Trematosphaeria pertusa TaxID=390896 RepID=A0A6A6HWB6_9PLEO|nr:uncharacterized protein BU26DRAFT_555891 [Trematosphaeria pertusa]KAF2241690.1 hypothetical protein BU26DRAFT_555891 [Trematosphaeria pertusa]
MASINAVVSIALLSLLQITSVAATYPHPNPYHSLPPAYLTPILVTSASTTANPFYPYPTSPSQNCSDGVPISTPNVYPTPPTPYSWTYNLPGTASQPSVYTAPSGATNGTYHPPTLTPESRTPKTEVHTTSLSLYTTIASSSEETAAVSSGASTPATGETTTTAQGATPTQSEPSEPLFTGSALRVPDMSVWKWNVVVSLSLGLMVMWI